MIFFLSSLILSLALLSACTKSQKQESKPVAVSIDTIPTIVDTIRRGFFGDDKLARIYYGTVYLTPSNIKSAQSNGEIQIANLLHSLGYEHVKIEWDK